MFRSPIRGRAVAVQPLDLALLRVAEAAVDPETVSRRRSGQPWCRTPSVSRLSCPEPTTTHLGRLANAAPAVLSVHTLDGAPRRSTAATPGLRARGEARTALSLRTTRTGSAPGPTGRPRAPLAFEVGARPPRTWPDQTSSSPECGSTRVGLPHRRRLAHGRRSPAFMSAGQSPIRWRIAWRARLMRVLSSWRTAAMLVPARIMPSSNASWSGSAPGISSPAACASRVVCASRSCH
jgi:hypothetical protein